MTGKARAVYLQRAEGGGWELVTADGVTVLRGAHYRELRQALDALTAGTSPPGGRIRILVGRSERAPARPVPAAAPAPTPPAS